LDQIIAHYWDLPFACDAFEERIIFSSVLHQARRK